MEDRHSLLWAASQSFSYSDSMQFYIAKLRQQTADGRTDGAAIALNKPHYTTINQMPYLGLKKLLPPAATPKRKDLERTWSGFYVKPVPS